MSEEIVTWSLYDIDGDAIVARSPEDAVAGWRAYRWREGARAGASAAADLQPASVRLREPIAWVAGARL